jgi:hypothetical protein
MGGDPLDPAYLVPQPDPLPAPGGLFYALLVITFILHLLVANVMLGGGMIALVNHLRKRGRDTAVLFGKELAGKIPLSIALTINLGIPPLLFLQVLYGHFIYVGAVLTAVYWLSIFVLVILAYYSAYLYDFRFAGPGAVWMIGLSVVLLLIVGFFFTNHMVIMADPGAWRLYFDRPGGRIIHLGDPTLIPRYLHFVLSSAAIGGLLMGIWGWMRTRKGDPAGEGYLTRGLQSFGIVTGFQFIVGALYLGALPNQVLAKAAFEGRMALPLFVISIGAALGSILFSFNRMVWHTAASGVLTVILMVLFRYAIQDAYLGPYLSKASPDVAVQYGPALLFLVAVIIGGAVVAYLIRLTLRAGREIQS